MSLSVECPYDDCDYVDDESYALIGDEGDDVCPECGRPFHWSRWIEYGTRANEVD